MKQLTFILIILSHLTGNAQVTSDHAKDYSVYYELINQAEESFIENQTTTCYAYFDSAFAQFDPFLKDPFIAAQIAFSLKDTLKFCAYLGVCFENGMPITAVNSSPLIKKANKGEVKHLIDSLFRAKYVEPEINKNQYNKICMMCYQSDSLKVYADGHGQAFNASEDDTRTFLLDSFLVHGRFPNEHLFGISTDAKSDQFYKTFNRSNPYDEWPLYKNTEHPPKEYDLYLSCPYNIVMHSQCFYWDHRDLFIKAMLNGFIHPKEIAIIEERSIMHQGKRGASNYDCLPLEFRVLYNVYGYNPMSHQQVFTNTPEGLVKVEANRAHIYLQKYRIDLKKRELEKRAGFKFFYDFAGK